MNYFNKRVYVAGIFQNKPENKEYIEKWCLKLSKIFPDYLFINGVSAFSYYYGKTNNYSKKYVKTYKNTIKKNS